MRDRYVWLTHHDRSCLRLVEDPFSDRFIFGGVLWFNGDRPLGGGGALSSEGEESAVVAQTLGLTSCQLTLVDFSSKVGEGRSFIWALGLIRSGRGGSQARDSISVSQLVTPWEKASVVNLSSPVGFMRVA
jgi:hypothetical protein